MKKLLSLFLLVAFSVTQAQVITLESSDGKEFTIEREKAEKSITLKNLIEDLKQAGQKDPIPLPGINGATLEIIVNCLEKPENIGSIVASLSGSALYEFNKAVGYLDIPDIYEQLPAIVWLRKKLQGIITGPVLSGHGGPVSAVAISSDGEFIVTGSWDKTARIWNTDGTQRAVLVGHEGFVISVAISPDGEFIVTGSWDKTARIWNRDGTQRAVLRGHEDTVASVAISPDGKFLVTGSWDKTVRIWNTDGTQRAALRGHEDVVKSVAISPDGKFIVTCSGDKTARIWNTDGTQRAALRGHEDVVKSVAISPDGKFIVTCSGDKTARIWNTDGTQRDVLVGHEDFVASVAISPDGKFIVTGSWDQTARVWSADGKQRAVLRDHENVVDSVAISSDGKFIVTGSFDNTVRIWFFGNQDSVNQLDINKINLITQIYEQVKQNQKLDLRQKPADTLKIRAEKKVEENLFRELPQDVQAVLRNAVIIPV